MSEDHADYRPRSPDLSGFVPPPSIVRKLSFHQPDTSFPPGYSFSPRASYDASPYFSPSSAQPQSSYFGSQVQAASPHTDSPQVLRTPSVPFGHQQSSSQSYIQGPQLDRPIYRSPPQPPPLFSTPDYQQNQEATFSNTQYPSFTPNFDMARTRQKKVSESFEPNYNPNNSAPSRTAMQPKAEQPPVAMPEQQDPTQYVDVKTKFPVARIKRIMQADEDVGKVAQATPTAVAKALELFMVALVSKGANEARAQNSKRVTAQHLKSALMKDGQFDFLADACADIPDEGTKKGRAKSEAKSEESDDGDLGNGKKKGKGGAKKRKADTDEDSD